MINELSFAFKKLFLLLRQQKQQLYLSYTFKITDRYIAFANDVAAGMEQAAAYQKNIARKKVSKATANVGASQAMAKSQIRNLVEELRKKRMEVAIKATEKQIAKEFTGVLLSTDELDLWHCSVIQGFVEIEEVVPVYNWQDIVDKDGVVIKRVRNASFMRIKRPPNVREKQASADALYKRRGSYAPLKMFGALAKVGEDGDGEIVQRFVLLSNGEKVPL